MSRGTWVWDRDTQRLVPKGTYRRGTYGDLRSDFPSPMLSLGVLDDVWNPADGKHYDNARAYERAIPKGHHIVEKGELNGGAKTPQIDTKEVERDIATAWDQLEAGHI